jgi:hypothetical protein
MIVLINKPPVIEFRAGGIPTHGLASTPNRTNPSVKALWHCMYGVRCRICSAPERSIDGERVREDGAVSALAAGCGDAYLSAGQRPTNGLQFLCIAHCALRFGMVYPPLRPSPASNPQRRARYSGRWSSPCAPSRP